VILLAATTVQTCSMCALGPGRPFDARSTVDLPIRRGREAIPCRPSRSRLCLSGRVASGLGCPHARFFRA